MREGAPRRVLAADCVLATGALTGLDGAFSRWRLVEE